MLRLLYIVFTEFPTALAFLFKALVVKLFPHKYTMEERFNFLRHYCDILVKRGKITTDIYGLEHLPTEGGYVLYPNHQGRYDVLGILYAHEKIFSVMMDKAKSRLIFANEFIILLDGVRLNRKSMRTQVTGIYRVVERVAAGERFIVFPEGIYGHNHNHLQTFLPGAFKCAIKAKSPIVPVALIDSYIPFEYNSIKPVRTQVHFLPPLYYDDYKDKTSQEVADIVRARINDKITEMKGETQ